MKEFLFNKRTCKNGIVSFFTLPCSRPLKAVARILKQACELGAKQPQWG